MIVKTNKIAAATNRRQSQEHVCCFLERADRSLYEALPMTSFLKYVFTEFMSVAQHATVVFNEPD